MCTVYLPSSHPLLSNPPMLYTNSHGPRTLGWGHMMWVSHWGISSQKISYFLQVNNLFFCVNSIYHNRIPSEEAWEIYYYITMLIKIIGNQFKAMFKYQNNSSLLSTIPCDWHSLSFLIALIKPNMHSIFLLGQALNSTRKYLVTSIYSCQYCLGVHFLHFSYGNVQVSHLGMAVNFFSSQIV